MNKFFLFTFTGLLSALLPFQISYALDKTASQNQESDTESEDSRPNEKYIYAGVGLLGGIIITAAIAKLIFLNKETLQNVESLEQIRISKSKEPEKEKQRISLEQQLSLLEEQLSHVSSFIKELKQITQSINSMIQLDAQASLHNMHNIFDYSSQYRLGDLSRLLKDLKLPFTEIIQCLVDMSCSKYRLEATSHLPFFKKFSKLLDLDDQFFPLLIANQLIYYGNLSNNPLWLVGESGSYIQTSREDYSSDLLYHHIFESNKNNDRLNYMINTILLPYVLSDDNLFFYNVDEFGFTDHELKNKLKIAVAKLASLNFDSGNTEFIASDYLDDADKAAFKEFIKGLFKIFNSKDLAEKFKIYPLIVQEKIILKVLLDLKSHGQLDPSQTLAIDALYDFYCFISLFTKHK